MENESVFSGVESPKVKEVSYVIPGGHQHVHPGWRIDSKYRERTPSETTPK